MAVRHIAATGNVDSEHLSSLIDGELDPREAEAVIDALCGDPELRRQWSDLQLVGDALRSTDVAACHVEGFCARVSVALAREPTVLAPPRARPGLRRYVVPGVAIAASVAAISFVAVPLLRSPAPQIAARQAAPVEMTAPVVASSEPASQSVSQKTPSAIANARLLEPYFAAHRELTGGTPLPRAAAYLRTGPEER